MGRPRLDHKCRDCGGPCTRRGRYIGGWSCIYCSTARYEEATRQIMAGEGEYYEKWVDGTIAALRKRRDEIDRKAADADAATPT